MMVNLDFETISNLALAELEQAFEDFDKALQEAEKTPKMKVMIPKLPFATPKWTPKREIVSDDVKAKIIEIADCL